MTFDFLDIKYVFQRTNSVLCTYLSSFIVFIRFWKHSKNIIIYSDIPNVCSLLNILTVIKHIMIRSNNKYQFFFFFIITYHKLQSLY